MARERPAIDWRTVQRELATVAQLCEFIGVTPNTLRAWRRRRDFPAPALRVAGRGGMIELWARSDVETWLAKAGGWRRESPGHRLPREHQAR